MDYRLSIGLNDKVTKKQEIATLEAYKIVVDILLNNGIGGATLSDGKGIYKHENGDIVIENTIIVDLSFIDDISIIYTCIELLKVALNQESIMLEQITKIVEYR